MHWKNLIPDLEREIEFKFVRSPGPGGQNVNKVATAVQLRFPVEQSLVLSGVAKKRLHVIARNRISKEGILIINAHRFRTRERNRQDALARFAVLIRRIFIKQVKRVKPRPGKAFHQKRLAEKKHRAGLKKNRGPVKIDRID